MGHALHVRVGRAGAIWQLTGAEAPREVGMGKGVAVVLVVAVVAGAFYMMKGGKPEQQLIKGASEMSEEEKIKQAKAYAAKWVDDFEARMKEKGAQQFIGEWKGVRPSEDGCDLELSKFSVIMEDAILACPVFTRAPIGGGIGRVLVTYKLPKGKDPIDAECTVKVLFGGGGSVVSARTYHPDPRIFAVWLKE
jgi:hypothetical protein